MPYDWENSTALAGNVHGCSHQGARSVTAKDTCDPTRLTLSLSSAGAARGTKWMRRCSTGAAWDNSAGVTAVQSPGAAAKVRSEDRGERVSALSSPLLSVALNSLATPSSLTKTLKWLLFWLDCWYFK